MSICFNINGIFCFDICRYEICCSSMAQLLLTISGKPFTTIKKPYFMGVCGFFMRKMNTSVSLCSMFAAKAQDIVVWNRQNPPNSTRVGWLYRWDELLSTTYFQCFTIVFLVLSDQHPRHVFVFQKIHLLLPLLDQSNQLSYWPNQSSQDCYQDWRDRF